MLGQLVHTAAVLASRYGALSVLQYCVEHHGASISEARDAAVCVRCDPPARMHGEGPAKHSPCGLPSVLHAAVIGGDMDMVQYVLAQGAPPDVRNKVTLRASIVALSASCRKKQRDNLLSRSLTV